MVMYCANNTNENIIDEPIDGAPTIGEKKITWGPEPHHHRVSNTTCSCAKLDISSTMNQTYVKYHPGMYTSHIATEINIDRPHV